MENQGHGSPGILWAQNALALLEQISSYGELARPELTRMTGLSRTTVVQSIDRLLEVGIIEVARLDHKRRGPVATVYRLNPTWATGIALDIGHKWIRMRVLDFAGNTIDTKTSPAPPPSSTSADLVREVRQLTQDYTPRFINVGVPGAVDPYTREISMAEGMAGHGKELASLLDAAFGTTVRIDNDVNLAAIAEHGSSNMSDFVYVSLGYGIGAAFMTGGQLITGARGAAGELAYLPGTVWSQRKPIGEESLALHASELNYPYTDAASLFSAAADGNDTANRISDELAQRLAHAIAIVGFVLDPEAIVVGGSMGQNSFLFDQVTAILDREYPHFHFAVTKAGLGSEAVLQGASTQLIEEMQRICFNDAVFPSS